MYQGGFLLGVSGPLENIFHYSLQQDDNKAVQEFQIRVIIN